MHGHLDIPLWLGAKDKRIQYVGNIKAQTSEKKWKEMTWAVSVYLDNLADWAGVSPDKIAFIIDGIRPQLYEPQRLNSVTGSFFSRMRRHFTMEATKRGYEVIDMQPRFIDRYEKTGRRFEFPTDSHWNGEGHAAAADAFAGSALWKSIFDNSF